MAKNISEKFRVDTGHFIYSECHITKQALYATRAIGQTKIEGGKT